MDRRLSKSGLSCDCWGSGLRQHFDVIARQSDVPQGVVVQSGKHGRVTATPVPVKQSPEKGLALVIDDHCRMLSYSFGHIFILLCLGWREAIIRPAGATCDLHSCRVETECDQDGGVYRARGEQFLNFRQFREHCRTIRPAAAVRRPARMDAFLRLSGTAAALLA